MDLASRIDVPELMDTVALPPPEMEAALGFLALTNRAFGGSAVVLRHLKAWSTGWARDREITLLDAGCGEADIPLAVARWARAAGFRMRITAVDAVAEAAAVARARTAAWPEISVRQEDVFTILAGERFDLVTASLFLHHLPPDRTPAALRALAGAANRGLIVSDLLRSRAGYVAVWAASRVFGNRVVRHDGPLSVRRAFTVPELAALAAESGCPWLTARAEPWFRVSLAGEKIS